MRMRSDRAMLLEKVYTIGVINEFVRKNQNGGGDLYLSDINKGDTKPYYQNQIKTQGEPPQILTSVLSVPITNINDTGMKINDGISQTKMHVFNLNEKGHIYVEKELINNFF